MTEITPILCKRLRQRWASMHQRCYNTSSCSYYDYGGRGIYVCTEWHDFKVFLAWAISSGFFSLYQGPRSITLERKAKKGPYSPDNCCWASYQEQACNRKDNVLVTYKGQTLVASLWARKVGLDPDVVLSRLRRNWSTQRALETPVTRGAWMTL